MVTTKMSFMPNTKLENEKAGLALMGLSYANLALQRKKDGVHLVYSVCKDADKRKAEVTQNISLFTAPVIYLRVAISKGGLCNFSYSLDGASFTKAGEEFKAATGRWKGAKVGLFCTRETSINDAGWADFDWFRVEAL